MKKRMWILAALMVFALFQAASGEQTLAPVIDAAERLAFSESNVTVSGQADFYLDGEEFKIAEITYVQDGKNSFWQEVLLTPRSWRPDFESGFTVIQNGWDIYVMETLHPGIYRTGTDGEQTTLLRRSPMADLLFSVAKTAAGQLEPFFDGGITESVREDGGTDLHFVLKEENAPPILSHLANLSLRFAGKRLFGIDGDQELIPDPGAQVDERTAVRRILYETKSLVLSDCDVSVSLDPSGRLTAVSGMISAMLTSYGAGEQALSNGQPWEKLLDIRFDIGIFDYGESSVSPFDSETYHVKNQRDAGEAQAPAAQPVSQEKQAALTGRARELCGLCGFHVGDPYYFFLDDGRANVCFEMEEEDTVCRVEMTEDGLLLRFTVDWGGFDGPGDPSVTISEAQKDEALSCLRQFNSALNVTDLTSEGGYRKEDECMVRLIGVSSGTRGRAADEVILIVRLEPTWRIEYFTCIGY